MPDPLMELVEVEKRYDASTGYLWWRHDAQVRAVDGVSFRLKRGETLGLVGESGSGKSTVAKLILHLTGASVGKILINGRPMDARRKADLDWLRRHVQIVFQDPYASLNPRMTVGDSVIESLKVFRIGTAAERRDKARQLLAEVGLNPDYVDRYPHEFSGGQRQRIGIARAIAMAPELVVLDEAVSALDVSVQAQVVNLLQDLQEQHGLTYIFISHDLSVTRHISTRIAVMYLGRIVEIGPTAAVFERSAHPYTRALIESIPDAHTLDPPPPTPLAGEIPSPLDIPTGCRFRTRCPYATALCAEQDPEERQANEAGHLVRCHYPLA